MKSCFIKRFSIFPLHLVREEQKYFCSLQCSLLQTYLLLSMLIKLLHFKNNRLSDIFVRILRRRSNMTAKLELIENLQHKKTKCISPIRGLSLCNVIMLMMTIALGELISVVLQNMVEISFKPRPSRNVVMRTKQEILHYNIILRVHYNTICIV